MCQTLNRTLSVEVSYLDWYRVLLKHVNLYLISITEVVISQGCQANVLENIMLVQPPYLQEKEKKFSFKQVGFVFTVL